MLGLNNTYILGLVLIGAGLVLLARLYFFLWSHTLWGGITPPGRGREKI